MIEEKKKQVNQGDLFNKIYGGTEKSLNGPIFFILIGIFCLIGFYFISFLSGTLNLQLFGFQETESIRPMISFPLFGIIQILLIVGTIIGLLLGPLGILWIQISK